MFTFLSMDLATAKLMSIRKSGGLKEQSTLEVITGRGETSNGPAKGPLEMVNMGLLLLLLETRGIFWIAISAFLFLHGL